MKSYSSFSFFILVASVSSFGAGNEVGNGGNAVICKKTVELLDFYESKILRGWELDPAATNTKDDAFSNAKSKIEALQKFDPKTARVLLAGLARLQKDFSFEQEMYFGRLSRYTGKEQISLRLRHSLRHCHCTDDCTAAS